MNNVLDVSSKNSYLTTKQWDEIRKYVYSSSEKNNIITEESNIVNIIDDSNDLLLESQPFVMMRSTPLMMSTNNVISLAFTDEYIYFDLNKANVIITDTTYEGQDGSGNVVSGTHSQDNKYYVFQSNDDYSGIDSLPAYASMDSWKNTIVNNSDVTNVIDSWQAQATKAGKTSTNNRIHITTKTDCDLTIDNIWSTYVVARPDSRATASIAYVPPSGATGTLTLNLIRHNRIESFHINNTAASTTSIVITSESEDNTLTVAATVDKGNYWASAIGNNDNSTGAIYNLNIAGGTIYAGTRIQDNCTAIGGGGNGHAGITISGGVITAVASTSGTAIGGGIGYSSNGGDGNITITGGTVYAYNHCAYLPLDGVNHFVPSAAIGGGSSVKSTGNKGTVIISDGTVYAQSIGGVAIGGGGSTTRTGGAADVKILGGNVTAKSVRGTVTNGTDTQDVLAGASIGGGTGKISGGNAIVTISGDAVINTGSIGGGKSTGENAPIGSANVTINGGTVHGQIVMAAGSGTPCSFVMNDGLIDNKKNESVYWENGTNEPKGFAFIEGNGGAVFVQNGTATLNSGIIQNCKDLSKQSGVGDGGGAIFVDGGDFIMNGGTIQKCDGHNGGGVLVKSGNVIIDGSKSTNDNKPYIYNNTARDGGGVMSWGGDSKITIKDATIHKNSCNGSGGGAYAHSGSTIEMYENVIISENKASGNGGGAASSGIITISGSTIKQNTAGNYGGGLYANANIIFHDGIINNNASKYGGGASVNNGSFIMENGTIASNTSALYGGGIYISKGNFTMTDGEVSSNTSGSANSTTGMGGGVYIENGNFNMQYGEIIDNNTTCDGGAIYISGTDNTTLTVESGLIGNNIALNYGGAIYITNGNIIIGTEICHNDGETSNHIHPIIENNIASNGGGIYVDGGVTTMWCGDIRYNKTYEKTVNVLVADGSFTYNGGTIGVPHDSGVFVNGGLFGDNTSEPEAKIKYELHYHSVLDDTIYNGGVPESKWIASPRGDILHKEDCDDSSPTWSDLFPEYEFVGWENKSENDTDETVNLYAIWQEK